MPKNLTQKILEKHLVSGRLITDEEIAIKIDQTLTQDATGTMAYLQFEAIGIPRVKTKLSVSYLDHNILQSGFENADDHKFLQTIAAKYGIYFSKPGNGICHQLHLERFGVPGNILIGSDSHTQTAGGLAMLAMGAGGLDVALAMAGQPFNLIMPKIIKVELSGKLKAWINSRDIAFELLKRLTVKGGVGKIFEFVGEGLKFLSVPERATITNLCTELGATSSLFPSDSLTKDFLKAQKRENKWKKLLPDKNCNYDEEIIINLSELEPMIAGPHSPDNIVKIKDAAGLKVDQVCIGSCANSSYRDLMIAANILKGKKVHPDVSLTISPGSKQVLEMITRNGALANLINAGVRILECACGPCIGMGQAPRSGGISLRTFTRNFKGRSGTEDSLVYLVSPEIAASSALKSVLTDPRKLGKMPKITIPKKFIIDDSMIISPSKNPEKIEIYRGPNIKPLPKKDPLPDSISGKILLKVGDNITTDDIMPAGAKILPLRSNTPAISEYVFEKIDKDFVKRAKENKGGFIIGGANYGQGSSREHAALAPMFLGVKAVIVKSFARIHRDNLINFGILPLTFAKETDYDLISQGDELELPNVKEALQKGKEIKLRNVSKVAEIKLICNLTQRQIEMILAGGTLNLMKCVIG